MKNLTTSDKSVLERLIRSEYDRLHSEGNQIDNSRYLQLIEVSEKLYLSNEFINELKIDVNGGPY